MENVRKNRDLIAPESVKKDTTSQCPKTSSFYKCHSLQILCKLPPPPKTAHKTYNINLHQLDILFFHLIQGHPTTAFSKISVRRSKYYLKFSIT